MTLAATPEALAEALSEFQRRNGYHRPEIEELLTEFGELVLATARAAHHQVTAERDADQAELARLRAEGEAKDRDNAVTALMVIALCNSVLGNAYLGKDGEEALAGHVKAAFMNTALARAITNTGD